MSTLTADHLLRLDAMETEDYEAHDVALLHPHQRSDSAGSKAAFDSDEERHDRLITPRELEEIEQLEKEIASIESPCYAKATAAAAAALSSTLSKHIRVGATVSDDSADAALQCESGPLRWYFAYGSNMNVAQLLTRIGAFEDKKLLYLPNYELRFNKRVSLKTPAVTAQRWNRSGNIDKCGFANVVPTPKKTVYGIAYLIHQSQIEKMDVYEGVSGGHYTRETMTCYDTEHRPLECVVYVAASTATADDLLPTEGYLSHLLGGRGLLPPEYTAMLERQPRVRR